MTDSIREQITQAVLARVQTITVANGYETDMGSGMARATRSFDEDELPAGTVWPGVEEAARDYHVTAQEMQMDIDGHATVGAETADAVCNRLIADIRKAMETHDATLSALIEGLQYTSAEPQYPEDGGDLASVKVSYKITYKIKRGDPYAQP